MYPERCRRDRNAAERSRTRVPRSPAHTHHVSIRYAAIRARLRFSAPATGKCVRRAGRRRRPTARSRPGSHSRRPTSRTRSGPGPPRGDAAGPVDHADPAPERAAAPATTPRAAGQRRVQPPTTPDRRGGRPQREPGKIPTRARLLSMIFWPRSQKIIRSRARLLSPPQHRRFHHATGQGDTTTGRGRIPGPSV